MRAAKVDSDLWKEKRGKVEMVFNRLYKLLAVENQSDWTTMADHIFDNLQSRKCHGIAYPCSPNPELGCVSTVDAEVVFEVFYLEFNFKILISQNIINSQPSKLQRPV